MNKLAGAIADLVQKVVTHHDASQSEVKSITLTVIALREWLVKHEVAASGAPAPDPVD